MSHKYEWSWFFKLIGASLRMQWKLLLAIPISNILRKSSSCLQWMKNHMQLYSSQILIGQSNSNSSFEANSSLNILFIISLIKILNFDFEGIILKSLGRYCTGFTHLGENLGENRANMKCLQQSTSTSELSFSNQKSTAYIFSIMLTSKFLGPPILRLTPIFSKKLK